MKYTPFATGWAGTATKANFMLADRDRMDNTVTYVTPSFAGVQVYAQYSFNRDGQETAGNERQNDRYAALGATYKNGAFSSALVVDTVMHNNKSANDKDSLGVTLGASYDFEVVKLFAMGQYGQHENFLGTTFDKGTKNEVIGTKYAADYFKTLSSKGWKGYGVNLGATAPVLGGTVLVQASYLDAKTHDGMTYESAKKGALVEAADPDGDELEVKDLDKKSYKEGKAQNWGIALGYTYPFSKRTNVYTYVSYNETQVKTEATDKNTDVTTKFTEFGLGIKHTF